MPDSIEIEGIAAVREQLRIPVPDAPGIVEIVGENGSGKSTVGVIMGALAYDHRETGLKPSDGLAHGHASGFGRSITVGASVTADGSVEINWAGGLDPTELIQPREKTAGPANKARLRCLCRVSGARVARLNFVDVLGGMEVLDQVYPEGLAEILDPVDFTADMKRRIEVLKRQAGEQATSLEGKAAGARKAIETLTGGADLTELPSIEEARATHTAAIRAHAAAEQAQESADALEAGAVASVRALRDLGTRGTEESTRIAAEQLDACRRDGDLESQHSIQAAAALASEIAHVHAKIKALEVASAALIARGKREATEALAVRTRRAAATKSAEDAIESERQAVEQRRQWEAAIKAGESAAPPSTEELERLALVVTAAESLVSRCDLAERTRELRVQAKRYADQALAQTRLHDRLLEAAAGTESILFAALARVCPPELSMAGELLCYRHPKRGVVPFSELSPGERAKVAFLIVARAAAERGEPGMRTVILIQQEFWDQVNDANRWDIHQAAVEANVLAYTMRAADGPLWINVMGAAMARELQPVPTSRTYLPHSPQRQLI